MMRWFLVAPAVTTTDKTTTIDDTIDETIVAHEPTTPPPAPKTSTLVPVAQLQSAVQQARNQITADLQRDYGSFYEPIFFPDGISRGRSILQPPHHPSLFDPEAPTDQAPPHHNKGWSSLVSKVAQKILQAHLYHNTTTTTTTTFVWASGGHSSSAGHGNFMHEAYTAVLANRIRPLFDALQVGFAGRNYGMSATAAAPELSMCSAAVYGQDVDVITWDFGLTDGRVYWKMAYYFWRMATASSSSSSAKAGVVPAMLALFPGDTTRGVGSVGGKRIVGLQDLYQANFPVLVENENEWKKIKTTIPTSATSSPEALPPAIRNFKCKDNFLEVGEPYCGAEKWNTTMCQDRKYMVSWHPGWKVHALQGNLLTMLLADVVEDALQYVGQQQELKSPANLLLELQAAERERYQQIKTTSPLPMLAKEWPLPSDVNPDWIWRQPSVCRTARAPAQSRLLGISANSVPEELNRQVDGQGDYFQGITLREAMASVSESSEEMRLVQDSFRSSPKVVTCNETWRVSGLVSLIGSRQALSTSAHTNPTFFLISVVGLSGQLLCISTGGVEATCDS